MNNPFVPVQRVAYLDLHGVFHKTVCIDSPNVYEATLDLDDYCQFLRNTGNAVIYSQVRLENPENWGTGELA